MPDDKDSSRPFARGAFDQRTAPGPVQAVAAGRCRITLSRAPDLVVDDCYSCDQQAASLLAGAGLIRPLVSEGQPGELVPAVLTSAGRAVLR